MESVKRVLNRYAVPIAALGVALQLTHFVLALLTEGNRNLETLVALGGFFLALIAMPVVGAILVKRVPGNAVGYICLAGSLVVNLQQISVTYVNFGLQHDLSFVLAAGRLSAILEGPVNLVLPALFLLFPTGRFLSRRWRRALVPVLVGTTFLSIYGLFAPRISDQQPFPDVHGAGTSSNLAASLAPLMYQLFTLGLAIAVISQFVRYRRADEQERAQIKWFGMAAVGVIVCEILLAILRPAGADVVWVFLFYGIFVGALPIAVGIAVLKYRLYDIDIVINKTIIFGGLAVFVSLLYISIVVVAGQLLGDRVGESDGVAITATAAVALAFAPAKGRLEKVADRIVYGSRSTPYEVLAQFSDRIAGSISVDEVLPQMAEAGGRGLRADYCRVGLLLPDGRWLHSWWPQEVDTPHFDRVMAVTHQGQMVGQIEITKPKDEPITKSDEELLAVLASQAAPAMHNVSLASELRQRLDQISEQARALAESRRRLVAAQDEERRRLERDIHDGVQQDMIGLSLRLHQAKSTIEDPETTRKVLVELEAHIADTTERLRSLARGVFPALLRDQGLAAALRSHVQKHFPDAEFVVERSLASRRFDPNVESAVYFCCLEALQNASRYAPGAPLRVALTFSGGTLTLLVADEGPGFDVAEETWGTGLMNMRDRMAVVGGTLEISSSPGRGTRVRGSIPVITQFTNLKEAGSSA